MATILEVRVIPASGRLVEGDILELSGFPCLGVGICRTSTELEIRMAKELEIGPEGDTGNDFKEKY